MDEHGYLSFRQIGGNQSMWQSWEIRIFWSQGQENLWNILEQQAVKDPGD